jgi:hypothetical protein
VRDAAELKEHPFFKGIDWTLLSLKQVPSPFKPVVGSDELITDFDPWETEMDMGMNEKDPVEDWSSIMGSGFIHTLQHRNESGLLGSESHPQDIQINSVIEKNPITSLQTNSDQDSLCFMYSDGGSLITSAGSGVMVDSLLSDDSDEDSGLRGECLANYSRGI